MRKLLSVLILFLVIILGSAGCGTTSYEEAEEPKDAIIGNGYFVIEKAWESDGLNNGDGGNYKIIYAKDTKVKYLYVSRPHGVSITPLLNPDGTPQLHEEK